jgi:hypothetical protein
MEANHGMRHFLEECPNPVDGDKFWRDTTCTRIGGKLHALHNEKPQCFELPDIDDEENT